MGQDYDDQGLEIVDRKDEMNAQRLRQRVTKYGRYSNESIEEAIREAA